MAEVFELIKNVCWVLSKLLTMGVDVASIHALWGQHVIVEKVINTVNNMMEARRE